MKTIILSAFGRFGDYAANSTEIVARQLHGRMIAGFKIHSIVFECNIPSDNRGEMLIDLAEENQASGIVALGMASDKKGLCVESVARNAINNPKYCPDLTGNPVNSDFHYDQELGLDLAPWNYDLFAKECDRKHVPVEGLSRYAGGFCCNHLMFQIEALQRANQNAKKPCRRIPFTFIHIPCSDEAVVDCNAHQKSGKILLPIDVVITGIEVLLEKASL